MYDIVEIEFIDGSSTIIRVHEDDSIQDAIVDACEVHGIDPDEVCNYRILRTAGEA